MILSDRTLHERGPQLIHPFDGERVQPSSIDLRLSNQFRVFTNHDLAHVRLDDVPPNMTEKVVTDQLVLHPGEFVLGSTFEVVSVPDNLVGRIEGKSSVGRLGLIVHATAGFIDPGFEGVLTLEMTNLLRVPIVLVAGLDICQVSFSMLNFPACEPYSGRYQGDMEPAGSRYGL